MHHFFDEKDDKIKFFLTGLRISFCQEHLLCRHGELHNRPGHRAGVVKLSTFQLCVSPNFFRECLKYQIIVTYQFVEKIQLYLWNYETVSK